MKNFNHTAFSGFYLLMVIFVIFADLFELQWMYYITKPIVLWIVFLYFKNSTIAIAGQMKRVLMMAAFFFCAIGDLVLMFSHKDDLFFIGGLVAFLLGHLFFTATFIREITTVKPLQQHWMQLAFATLVVVYGAEFFILNRFSFGNLMIPVLVYCIAITAMGVSATMRDSSVNKNAYLKVVTGAVFFIISDSLLATNKFIQSFDLAGPLILGTYFIAQYLILIGVLNGFLTVEDNRVNRN